MRGPQPQPTTLKALRGNPGKRALNKNEPQPRAVSRLPCPKWMPKEGKEEWNRVVRELAMCGLLTKADQGALHMMCKAYATWRKNEDWIDQHGDTMVIRDEKGKPKYIQQMPQVGIANKAFQQYRSLAAEFGLTPASRTRISTPAKKEVDEGTVNRFFGA